jgi:Protein of unknown function (DUF2971)
MRVELGHPLVEQFRRRLWQPASFAVADFMPTYVYHYTTAAGFAGIVQGAHLRATNFSFLNDPSEVTYGMQLAQALLTERKVTLSDAERLFVDLIKESLNVETVAEVYVSCFTRLPDDLSQWRAYGSFSIERYAIGFDTQALQQVAAHEDMSFAEILYTREEQVARISFFLDRVFAFIEDEAVACAQWPLLAGAVAQSIARVLPEMKDSAYKTEREWRIIQWHGATSAQTLSIDTARGVLRPYLKVKLPVPLPIGELRFLAPTRKSAASKAAHMLLRKGNVADVEPRHSEVPFAE